MTAVTRHFGEAQRRRLRALFAALGTDNVDQAELARSAINSLLREYDKDWGNLIELLGDRPADKAAAIDADLARDIAALGSSDPDARADARRNIADLLARHRKNWNDLTNVLGDGSPAAWACGPPAGDPPRVNPLALVHHLLGEYVALAPHEYIAVALWVLHTHVYNCFQVTPRLALHSPTADSGKTTLLDIVAKLAARSIKFDSITTAAIYHLIDETHPTLLLDEADNLGIGLRSNGRLRAVLNGYRNDSQSGLMERGTTHGFSLFAPLALALPEMRGLPRTLESRSISIMMERSERTLRRLDINRPDPAFDAAYQQILLWRRELEQRPDEVKQNLLSLRLDPDPSMPAGFRNRSADNWRCMLSIADALGWGERAREAMIKFAREYVDADVKILLLSDIRKVFDARAFDRMSSKTLLTALHALDEAEWCEFRGARGDQHPHKIRDTELAGMLRDFGIRSRTLWPPNRTPASKAAKGYRRSQFEKAWRQYCGDDDTPSHTSNIKGLRVIGGDT